MEDGKGEGGCLSLSEEIPPIQECRENRERRYFRRYQPCPESPRGEISVKRYIIDTHVLLSFVTDRNPDQQRKITEVLEEAAISKGVILCPQNVLTEFSIVLDKVYGVAKSEIQMMVRDFLAMPGIELVHEIDFPTLFDLWPDVLPDLGDAIVASLGCLYRGSTILTFDLKFIHTLKKLRLPFKKV